MEVEPGLIPAPGCPLSAGLHLSRITYSTSPGHPANPLSITKIDDKKFGRVRN